MRHFAPIHRLSIFACAALAGGLLHTGLASAVALGNIAQQSSLGQPLRVTIPVALNTGETLTTQCLKLVRDPEAGAPQLLTGRVSLERTAAATRVVVTTPRAIDEPAMRLSLEAGCNSTVRRDYVLLFDPQGTPGDVVLASADTDEFKNYRGAAPPAVATVAAHHAQPVTVAMAGNVLPVVHDIAPSKTTFAPLVGPTPAPVAQSRTQKPAAPVQVAPVEVALATPPAPQREPIAMTTMQTGGFIAEAGASPLSRVSTVGSNPNPNLLPAPIANAMPRTRAPAPEATLWTQTWPYGAMGLSLVAIALTAFAKRKRIAVPAWGAPTVLNGPKSSMDKQANTFAHFPVMTEQMPPNKRAELAYPTVSGDSTYDGSLDTLLEQIPDVADPNVVNDNEVDEHTIRSAYASLASEGAVDIGADSILKAIAEAERELRMGRPEPKQAAMDKALDEDLLREPKLRK